MISDNQRDFIQERLADGRFPHVELNDFYRRLMDNPTPLIYGEHGYYNLHRESDPDKLLRQVIRKEVVCCWLIMEPFRYCLDIDLYSVSGPRRWSNFVTPVVDYNSPYKEQKWEIKEILRNVQEHCDKFLVCQTIPAPEDIPNRLAFNVFTDRIVNYEEAKSIEIDLASKISAGETFHASNVLGDQEYDFPVSPIGAVFNYFSPFAFRRSAFSIHYDRKPRLSIPRFDLSNVDFKGDLEAFLFSNPNWID